MKRIDPEQVRANMKAIRRAKGLTQTDVAKALGVTKQAVSRYEREPQALSVSKLLTLAELYGCSPRDFLHE